MEINRHNYEAYLLDQLEGNLSVEDQQKLHDFLLLNPDCISELSELEPWTLESEKVNYAYSQSLKKEFPDHASILTDGNFDMFSIARKEGDLSDDQIAAHQNMVDADDSIAQLWEQWQKTSLVPETLIFEGKDQLIRRHRSGIRVIMLAVISTAAALALLFVLFNTVPDLSEPANQLAAAGEEAVPQVQDLPQEAPDLSEPRMILADQAEDQKIKAITKPPVQKLNSPRPPEAELEVSVVPGDDLQPRVLAQATKRISKPTASMEAVPDRIEPLYVPPVPIHMSSLSIVQLSELDLQEVIEDYTEEKDLSLWKVAAAGIKGINKLAGSNISLMASRDDEGDVSGYRLKSKRFSLTRPLAQED